jgi:hypothetical protein
MVNRFAVLLAVALAVGAALLAFVPASANGTDCGIWAVPGFGKSEAQAISDKADAAPADGALDDEASSLRSAANDTYEKCDSKLDQRRMWTLILFAASLVATPAVLVVAGLDEDQTATA